MQAFFVLPIVAHSSFNVIQVDFFTEFLQFSKLVFAKDSVKSCRCHIQQLGIWHRRDSKLARNLSRLVLFSFDIEEADFDKFLETKKAASIDLSDKIVHINLFGRFLPNTFSNRDHSLLSYRNFGLHLELSWFDKVQCVAVRLSNIVYNFIFKESLWIQYTTNILDQMIGHRSDEWDLQDELLPVDLHLLLLKKENLSEIFAFQV